MKLRILPWALPIIIAVCVGVGFATPESEDSTTAVIAADSPSTAADIAQAAATETMQAASPADAQEGVSASEPNKLVHFAGKLHPISVHFPIALLILAALVEILSVLRCQPVFGQTVRTLLAFGVAGSIVAAPLGWANAATSEHTGQEQTVEQHRWLGVASTATSVAALLLGTAASRKGGRTLRTTYLIVLLAAAIGTSVAGHLGGALVYGDDYLKL